LSYGPIFLYVECADGKIYSIFLALKKMFSCSA